MVWRERLFVLLESATQPDSPALPEEPTRQIKCLLRSHQPAIECTFEFLGQRIKVPDAHVRLLVVEMVDHLFARSKEFRKLVANHLQDFLRYSVGFDIEYPLPGRSQQSNRLRNHALQVVQTWNRDYGHRYRQIEVGYNYLKDFLKFRFPDAEARIRQEEAARSHRAMQILKLKYSEIIEAYEEVFEEIRSVSQQLIECISLIEDEEERSTPWCSNDADKMELEWEEECRTSLDAPFNMEASILFNNDQTEDKSSGLRSYACYGNTPSLTEETSKCEKQRRTVLEELDEAIIVVLRDLTKIAFRRLLPTLQAWIKTLTQVDVDESDSGERSRRERLLALSVNQKVKLQDINTRLTSLGVEYEALHGYKLVKELSSPRGSRKAKKKTKKRKRESSMGQPKRISDVDPTAPKAGSRYFLDASCSSPKHKLENSHKSHQSVSEGKHESDSAIPVQKSKLPKAVLVSLLSKAPVVEGGSLEHFDLMESSVLPMQRSGTELYNHWGRVDDSAMLPSEVAAKHMGQKASYYQPPSGSVAGRDSSSVEAKTRIKPTGCSNIAGVNGVGYQLRLPMNAAERKIAIREEDRRHTTEVARLTSGSAGWEEALCEAKATVKKRANAGKWKKLFNTIKK